MLNYNNVDPLLGQLMTQMMQIKQQIVLVRSVDTSIFLLAIDSFVNHIGEQIQIQASKENLWNYTAASPISMSDIAADSTLSAEELLKTISLDCGEDLV
jgi:uncharacterized protein (DUF1501 family)